MSSVHDPAQLLALGVLLETRSVTAAARRLGISQSALSHTLARLRERFEDPLLVRVGAALTPTPRALLMEPLLRAAILDLEAAVRVVPTYNPKTASRTFRLATTDLVDLVVLPKLLLRLQGDAPGVDIQVSPAVGSETALQRGDLDIAIQPRSEGPSLRRRALYRERFVVMHRLGHPLSEVPLTVERFVGARHCLVAPQGTPGGVVDNILLGLGLSRRTVLVVPSFLAVPHIVATTDLLATLPERVAQSSTLPVLTREHPLVLPGFTLSMVWHEQKEGDPGHAWLRDLLSEVVNGGPTAA